MTDVPLPDIHYLSAAVGWLELGNPSEAGEEIARISPEVLTHPEVLEVRWQVCAAGQRWDPALEVAELLMQKAPDRPAAWLHRAYAMRRAKKGSLEKAWDVLFPAAALFPKEALIPYNLACYATQLGRLDEGWDLLQKAIEACGDDMTIKKMALADHDLEPLRERLQGK
jgi:tetratricopeptide (TPR) repeat protein